MSGKTPSPCNIRRNDAKIDPEQLVKEVHRKKVMASAILLVFGVVGAILFVVSPPLVGFEPINPVQGSGAIFIGMMIGAGVTIIAIVIFVAEKKKKKK